MTDVHDMAHGVAIIVVVIMLSSVSIQNVTRFYFLKPHLRWGGKLFVQRLGGTRAGDSPAPWQSYDIVPFFQRNKSVMEHMLRYRQQFSSEMNVF